MKKQLGHRLHLERRLINGVKPKQPHFQSNTMYTIVQPHFQTNIPLNQWYIAPFFQIWSFMPVGYEELAGDLSQSELAK